MPKQILSWQSKFNKILQTYLLARSNVPRFSTKKESVIKLKMTNFVWCQKTKIFFMTHLFLTFVNKEIFFQEYVGMELKIIFIIFEVFFEWQKQNITVVTFKQASITCR